MSQLQQQTQQSTDNIYMLGTLTTKNLVNLDTGFCLLGMKETKKTLRVFFLMIQTLEENEERVKQNRPL